MASDAPSPFGVHLDQDGAEFRLWAPVADRVDLLLEGGAPEPVPMTQEERGWFRCRAEGAGAGSLYRFRIDGQSDVPDPASRFQPEGVHGPSEVVDPGAYAWRHPGWKGRPWHEAVFYELHVGTFTEEGTFDGVRDRLGSLVELGVTAVELMPVAAFPGTRNWGYDGVLPFAPHAAYGTPESLKRLVDEAHEHGLMIFLDVVYNHFGPEGNYLHAYAPDFFTGRFDTPWGDAIDFSRDQVRRFFIENALFWLEEYRFDGLRLDAVHAIEDESTPHILEELAATVLARFDGRRRVHLVLENGDNEARFLSRTDQGAPRHYAAQWNDDAHHALHVLATGEADGYYGAYVDDPVSHLGRCLAEGFTFQGEPFFHWEGQVRGEPSAHLPPTAFIDFLQNHDQVGNRAFGERITDLAEAEPLEALLAVLLLSPSPPLLFMGEEWAAPEPFPFFCDFGDELAESVREGRRREFARFPAFRDERARERIPDPNSEATFRSAILDWSRTTQSSHRNRLDLYGRLLGLRAEVIVPRLEGAPGGTAHWARLGRGGLLVRWELGDGSRLTLLFNAFDEPVDEVPPGPHGHLLYGNAQGLEEHVRTGSLPGWSVAWFLA